MKRMWMVYGASALVAVGAGVAIAGVPSNGSSGGAIADLPVMPATTTLAMPTTAVPTTAVPADTTVPPETTTTTTTTPTTTTPTTTTVAPGTDPADDVPPGTPAATVDRANLAVDVANGLAVTGLASQAASALESLGYVGVGAANTAVVEVSRVYFAPGFEGEAVRLAGDAGLPAASIAPIAEAPPIEPTRLLELLVVLGTDRL
jgi:hypothetical protein